MTKKYKTFPHFIAYFDILGYSNIVQNRLDFNLASIIDKMLANKFFRIKKEINIPIRPKSYCFSDNFVICFRRKKRMSVIDYTQFGWLIIIMQQLQTLLSIKGVFIRGAIIEGDLYTGKNFIYGKGIIDAHAIEDKIAIYPRIVISKGLVEKIIDHTISMAKEVSLELSSLNYDINNITEKKCI